MTYSNIEEDYYSDQRDFTKVTRLSVKIKGDWGSQLLRKKYL